MLARVKFGIRAEEAGWTAVKIFGLLVVLGALITSSSRGLVRSPFTGGPNTVIPAAIRASRIDMLTVSFPARVEQLKVAPGDSVKAGQLLAVLTSEDLDRQVSAARRRVAVAEARSAGAHPGPEKSLYELQSRSAERSLELARARVSGFSADAEQSEYAIAQKRREKIAALVKQHMATAAELESAEREETNAFRNLKSSREQQSRLQQELDLSEVQSAMLRIQAQPTQNTASPAELDLEDARAALESVLQHQSELKVTAPHDGIVLSSTLSTGDRVYAGSPIVYVADVSRLSFEAAVGAGVARQIRPGDAVRLRLPTEPPSKIEARISYVALAPDPVQQNYIVRAIIDNPDPNAILVGMEGAIEVQHSESTWRRPF